MAAQQIHTYSPPPSAANPHFPSNTRFYQIPKKVMNEEASAAFGAASLAFYKSKGLVRSAKGAAELALLIGCEEAPLVEALTEYGRVAAGAGEDGEGEGVDERKRDAYGKDVFPSKDWRLEQEFREFLCLLGRRLPEGGTVGLLCVFVSALQLRVLSNMLTGTTNTAVGFDRWCLLAPIVSFLFCNGHVFLRVVIRDCENRNDQRLEQHIYKGKCENSEMTANSRGE